MGESNPAGGRTLVFPQETLLKVQQNCEQIPLGMMRKAITVAETAGMDSNPGNHSAHILRLKAPFGS